MKKAQYRKYKEIYRIDLDILKQTIENCDAKINEINKTISNSIKKQKGGTLIDSNMTLYLLIPNNTLENI